MVPVDFSTTSKKAFRFAVEIAAKTDGIIILIHFYTPEKKAVFGSREIADENNRMTESNCLVRLKRLKKKVLEESGANVVISTIVGRTPVIDNMLKYAAVHQIDMIVMGTQGAGGLKKVIIGSVASNIIAEAEIPVILIPEKYGMKKIEHVVFTTDIKKTDRKALPLVFDFAGLHEAPVTVVNLLAKSEANNHKSKEDFDTYANHVKKTYPISKLDFKQIETKSVAKTMENLLEELPYDVLAMARRKLQPQDRIFQKSFTKDMAFMTTQPLIVVPEEISL